MQLYWAWQLPLLGAIIFVSAVGIAFLVGYIISKRKKKK